MTARLLEGDCREVLAGIPGASVDSVVTDPPYELGFMGKKWDASGIAYSVELWREVLRVLKPGGHLLAFGGTRTYHRMACAIEDAGFSIRDSLMWCFGTGFPKSLNVSKAIDEAAGAVREVVGVRKGAGMSVQAGGAQAFRDDAWVPESRDLPLTAPSTEAAKQWDGWGTALKPAHEPIVMARKPLTGTVAANVLEWGTGALNIDGCRLEGPGKPNGVKTSTATVGYEGGFKTVPTGTDGLGRWPANILFDEDAARELDAQSGTLKSGARNADTSKNPRSIGPTGLTGGGSCSSSEGGASRFFYVAKPSRKERGTDNKHPTVKPTELMRYLVRLVTPPGGVVLDPFLGSGTTALAAIQEGFSVIGIEKEPAYLEIARQRIGKSRPVPKQAAFL